MKYLKLFEEAPARRKVSNQQIEISKKVTEYCEDYIQDIIDECNKKDITIKSFTRALNKSFEWVLIIRAYYPIHIDNLLKRLSIDFEINNWWIESSDTSSKFSEMEKKTELTINLNPKSELNHL